MAASLVAFGWQRRETPLENGSGLGLVKSSSGESSSGAPA